MHKKSCKGGERLVELLKNTHLVVSNTRFCPPKTAPLGSSTYHTPETEKRPRRLSQIDHICISKRYANSIVSSRVRWYPAIRRHAERFDHGLVEARFRFKIASRNRNSDKRLDFTELKKEHTRLELDKQVKINLESRIPGMSRDDEYSQMINAVQRAQEEVLSVVKSRKHRSRKISEEAEELIEERARLCQSVKSLKGKRRIKEAYRRKLSKQLKQDWEKHVKRQIEEIKRHHEAGNSKQFWEATHAISGRSRSYSNIQPSSDSASELKNFWLSSMQEKFKATDRELKRSAMQDIGPATTRESDGPTNADLEICLKALRDSKACGPDGIPAEVWRSSDHAKAHLFTAIKRFVREEILPSEMPLGEFVMIFKQKGLSSDASRY